MATRTRLTKKQIAALKVPEAKAQALRLTPTRLRLARDVLAMTEDYRGGCNGCDDFELPEYVTHEEAQALAIDFWTWNGSPEDANLGMRLGWNGLSVFLREALLAHAEKTLFASLRQKPPAARKPRWVGDADDAGATK